MAKRINHEAPIHIAILNYLKWQFPGAVIHHSVNEGNRGGVKGARDGYRNKAMGQRAGWPDLVMLYHGRFWAFEVKAPKGKLSDAQALCGADIQRNGWRWAVVRSVDEVKAHIKLWQAATDTIVHVEMRGVVT